MKPSPTTTARLLFVSSLLLVVSSHAAAQVELFDTEAEYLDRLAELNLPTLTEGFESAIWDDTRSTIVLPAFLTEVASEGILWEPAAKDVWGNNFSTRQHGLSSNANWARSGQWGVFENHQGEPFPTTIRVSAEVPIYGVGGWFNTNPDGQSVGFLFEDRTTASNPGYFIPGFGVMYPGDTPSFGHVFVGLIDPEGFTSVVLSGTLAVNEKGLVEGGIIYGADDFTFGVPVGFGTITADFTGEGCVDSADLAILLANWGAAAADLNADGLTDSSDLAVLLAAWTGTGCNAR